MATSAAGLYYETAGEGVPILLIHPAGATASTWGAVTGELAAIGRLVTYDRRGFGRTGGEPTGSIPTHTADAAALLDELELTGAVVAGTSIGATIAIDLARVRPDLVRAVVAHESPWHVTRQRPTRRQIAALSTMAWRARRRRDAQAVDGFLRFAYTYRDGGSAWDRFPAEWRQIAADNAVASLDDIQIAVGNYPTAKQLAEVTRPVICSCGSRTPENMHRVGRRLVRTIPTATFQIVDAAGHAAPFDAPANFAKLFVEAISAT